VQEKADKMAKEIAARKAKESGDTAAAAQEELKNIPPLAEMAAAVPDERFDDEDEALDTEFKSEAISGETKVLNEEGKPMPLPKK
jgi:hypothetical protein